jgi:hypothetical protein
MACGRSHDGERATETGDVWLGRAEARLSRSPSCRLGRSGVVMRFAQCGSISVFELQGVSVNA